MKDAATAANNGSEYAESLAKAHAVLACSCGLNVFLELPPDEPDEAGSCRHVSRALNAIASIKG